MVSIIIPVFNVENYLKKCLDSVLSQTYKDLEIILVDDGSSDNSAEIIKKYSETDSRIKTILKENGGVSSARNEGLKIATGEYICFLDSDDIIDENFIEELLNALIKANADISCCSIKWVDNEVYKVSEIQDCVNETKDLFKDFFIEGVFKELLYAPVNKIFKAETLKALNFNTDYALGEDVLFVFEALLRTEKICFTNKTAYYYIQRNTSAMHTKTIEKLCGYISAAEDIYNLALKNHLNCIDLCFTWRYKHILNLMFRAVKEKKNFADREEYYAIIKKHNPLSDIKSNFKRIFILLFGAKC